MSSFVHRWVGYGLLPRVIVIGSISLCGTTLPVNAAPPPPSPWDVAFCSAISQDYVFRGITQPSCIKVYAGVEGGVARSNGYFEPNPPFNVDGTGAVFGLNAGFLYSIPGTIFSVGPRVGILFGSNLGGNTFYPTSGFVYSTKTEEIPFAEMEFRFHKSPAVPLEGWNYDIYATVGAASVRNEVTGTSGAFTVSDSATRTAPTASLGISVPITNNIDIFGQVRGIWVPTTTFDIPGAVPVTTHIYMFTAGFEYSFGDGTPFTPRK